jgi:hypothetical protein
LITRFRVSPLPICIVTITIRNQSIIIFITHGLGYLITDRFRRFLLMPHLSDDILLHNAHNIRMFYLLQDIHENHWQVVYYTQGICHALVYL